MEMLSWYTHPYNIIAIELQLYWRKNIMVDKMRLFPAHVVFQDV